jgi:hypothetical protein
LVGYALVSFGVVEGQSLIYQVMSLVGAVGLIVLGLARKAIPSVALNIIWGMIAVGTILWLLLRG